MSCSARGVTVTLSVGEHIRAPRVYRGKDLEWWMDAAGVLDERYDQVDDIARARRVPSLQLAGTPDRTTLDLNALSDIGVRLVGRLAGITEDGKAQFPARCATCARSPISRWAGCSTSSTNGRARTASTARSSRRIACRRPASRTAPPLGIDLVKSGIRTIIWATGYRPDYSWLELPVLDRKGYVRHDGGVAEHPGVYLMGMQFLRRRKSALIDGAGDDARDLSDHLASYLRQNSI